MRVKKECREKKLHIDGKKRQARVKCSKRGRATFIECVQLSASLVCLQTERNVCNRGGSAQSSGLWRFAYSEEMVEVRWLRGFRLH